MGGARLTIRTDHFVSAATGHQQSNRGGGSAGAATYWEVRNAKMAEQAREKVGWDTSLRVILSLRQDSIYISITTRHIAARLDGKR